MPISFTCKACGRPLRVKDSLAGRTGKCPGCGNSILVPDDRARPAEPPARDRRQDDFGDDFYTDTDTPRAVAAAPGRSEAPPRPRRPCPACGEMIVRSAIVCRFCGEDFGGRSRRGDSSGSGSLTAAEWLLAILCPFVGCVFSIVFLMQGKPKGVLMLVVSVVMMFVFAGLPLAIRGG